MRYISLSFDDVRADTYSNVLPTLKKYGLPATVNVISDFVIHREKYSSICSSPKRAMTIKEITEWKSLGFEVACHGAFHRNTAIDVIRNIEESTYQLNISGERINMNEVALNIHKIVEKCIFYGFSL